MPPSSRRTLVTSIIRPSVETVHPESIPVVAKSKLLKGRALLDGMSTSTRSDREGSATEECMRYTVHSMNVETFGRRQPFLRVEDVLH